MKTSYGLLCALVALSFTCGVRADETDTPTATKPTATKPTATKPTGSSSTSAAKKVTPLHEHPTLVQMLARNNELRRQAGLASQTMSPELCQASQDHAQYMASTRSFSHYVNGSPGSRAQKHGYGGGVRENIAMGYRNVHTTFTGWRNSGGHWANMTSNTSKAGFGYAISASGQGYWVAMYGN
ncbi:MAG: hypothetical protein ACI9HK_000371 [Pirellulaceae bacterium]|jgi:uncharacterized protein YkwD